MTKDKVSVIYILGISFCGSTLIGYLLGASQHVFYAGEMKLLNRVSELEKRLCGCGKTVKTCPFWKGINFNTYRMFNKPTLSEKVTGACKINNHLKGLESSWGGKTDDVAFYKSIKDRMQEVEPEATYILDASKSIFRLLHLLQYSELDLRIIYIEREINGNVASFVKYNQGFMNGLFTYKANQLLARKLLKRTKRPFLCIRHENLCKNPVKQFRRIGNFLDIDYSNINKQLQNRTYHVFTGNIHTHRQFQESFQGLRIDNSWQKRLNTFQKNLIRMAQIVIP